MDTYSDSYQNGGGRRDTDFQKLAQNIGTNIQKILQNGIYSQKTLFWKCILISYLLSVSSMQRMIGQIGTPQDSQQLQNQL